MSSISSVAMLNMLIKSGNTEQTPANVSWIMSIIIVYKFAVFVFISRDYVQTVMHSLSAYLITNQ